MKYKSPMVGSVIDLTEWSYTHRRLHYGKTAWIEECTAAAKALTEVLYHGGRAVLNSSAENIRVTYQGDVMGSWGIPPERYREAAVHLAWIYVYIRTFGGAFSLTGWPSILMIESPTSDESVIFLECSRDRGYVRRFGDSTIENPFIEGVLRGFLALQVNRKSGSDEEMRPIHSLSYLKSFSPYRPCGPVSDSDTGDDWTVEEFRRYGFDPFNNVA